jgi:hypothetical protein
MSKFANTFLKSLNEEKEGNAFTAKLAKTKKGGTFEINGKKVKDTSNYDDHSVKEKKMNAYAIGMAAAKKAAHDEPPLKKSTIKKAHKIAKGIMKEQAEGEDEQAWQASLDKGTDPKDFETPDNPQVNIDASGVEAARSWVAKLEDMAEFVNGTGPESLNSKINDLELKNSVPFRGVVRREEKRITKLAENLRGLAEVFKSVIIGSQKKIQDATGPR